MVFTNCVCVSIQMAPTIFCKLGIPSSTWRPKTFIYLQKLLLDLYDETLQR